MCWGIAYEYAVHIDLKRSCTLNLEISHAGVLSSSTVSNLYCMVDLITVPVTKEFTFTWGLGDGGLGDGGLGDGVLQVLFTTSTSRYLSGGLFIFRPPKLWYERLLCLPSPCTSK